MEDLIEAAFSQRCNPSPGVHIQPGQSNIVLLTVTTDRRNPWLANETARQLLHQTWTEATAWLVGDYLLMPDHLHCFCAPHDVRFTIETWISYWKREFALKVKAHTNSGGARLLTSHLPEANSGGARLPTSLPAAPNSGGARLPTNHPSPDSSRGHSPHHSPPNEARPSWKFQSRGWHHRLRDGENHSEKWLYVQENPVRKGLCQQIDDWPFKGRVFDLIWTGKQ